MMIVMVALIALLLVQLLAPSIALIIEPNQPKQLHSNKPNQLHINKPNMRNPNQPQKVSQYIPKKPKKISVPFYRVSEILNGRTAMAGFTVGIINEVVTGQSFAQQAQSLVNAADERLLAAFVIGLLTLLTFEKTSIRKD